MFTPFANTNVTELMFTPPLNNIQSTISTPPFTENNIVNLIDSDIESNSSIIGNEIIYIVDRDAHESEEDEPQLLLQPPHKKRRRSQKHDIATITYELYISPGFTIKKWKLPELKATAKRFMLPVSGNKTMLIERIVNHFTMVKNAIIIQRVFRGMLIRMCSKLRGPAAKQTSICLNESDGFTLEPLNEMDYKRFVSFEDDGFVYGFDIGSLINCFKTKGYVENPYNRKRFQSERLNNLITLARLIHILYPGVLSVEEQMMPAFQATIMPRQRRMRRNQVIYNESQTLILRKLETLQNMSIQQRITEIFIEIDSLGNYSQSSWFTGLNIRELLRFYRCIYDIWHYSQELNNETRNQICQFGNPFPTINQRSRLTFEIMQNICLNVIESMVFTGVDRDACTLGAFYVLTALTVVSYQARQSMPWLYESLI